MATVATDTARVGNWLKHVEEPTLGVCTKKLIVRQAAAATYLTGTVLARTNESLTATSAAATGNTGDGTMGAITVYPNAKIGTYKLRVTTTGATASFSVYDPTGEFIGQGAVASAFTQGGLSFTLADGSADYTAGDVLNITVAGTEKWAVVSDGWVGDLAILISDPSGVDPVAVAAATDTNVVALVKGTAIVGKTGLVVGASVSGATELAAIYAKLEAQGIRVVDQY